MEGFGLKNLLFGTTAPRERRTRQRASLPANASVLLIDDSRTILHVLRNMLTQGGFQVLEAPDAETGIELAREYRPNLVFMDVVLPGMNGFEATRVLTRDRRTAGIPVVVMSGNAQATEQFWVLRIGASGFMIKPFTRAAVYEHVNRLAYPAMAV